MNGRKHFDMTDDLSDRIARLSPEKRELFDRLLAGRHTPRSDESQDETALPSGETEIALASIWAQVLRAPRIGRYDDYFALGGDSIVSIQIIAKSRRAGLHFTSRELFDHPTIAELAMLLDRPDRHTTSAATPEGPDRGDDRTFPDARLSDGELRTLLRDEE